MSLDKLLEELSTTFAYVSDFLRKVGMCKMCISMLGVRVPVGLDKLLEELSTTFAYVGDFLRKV